MRETAGDQLTTMRDSDGGVTSYGYDPVGRLTGIWAPNGENVTLAHDAGGGRLTEKTFPNGVSSRYTWNADNTLSQLLTQVGSTVISQHDYTYDGVGNRQTHIERIGAATTPYKYVYDEVSRLKEVRNNTTNALIEGYTYDPLGNRLSKTDGVTTYSFFHDTANQVTKFCVNDAVCTAPTHTFAYDLNGNLASRVDGSVTTSFFYDPENRLLSVTNTSTNTNTVLGTYAYDDQGRRVRKLLGTTTAQYLYNGADIVAEYDSTWVTPPARYTHGPGADEPLLRTTATGTQYYHQDGLGSVVALTNPDGTTAATARYDAWGTTLTSTGTIPQYGYTGREPDEIGLLYYWARYCDPTLGRFTQRDPIGLAGGINPYAHGGGNPVNFTEFPI